jgi:hypothetical protein
VARWVLDVTTWRLTVHRRSFATPGYASATGIAELHEARSRSLVQKANAAAELRFTLDGRSPAAALVDELTTDVLAWRDGRLMFRGVVSQSQDTVTEQSHTTNFVAHDYLAALVRRFLSNPAGVGYVQTDQDSIAADLYRLGTDGLTSSDGATPFTPGSYLPLEVHRVGASGADRPALSGVLRDRDYTGQTSTGQAILDLGACIGGFDVDVWPRADADGVDWLRIFYPAQGRDRADLVLDYGSTVSALTRSVNSADYSNLRRTLGAAPTDQAAPQMYAEAWNADANDVGRVPVGVWQGVAQESDVSVQSTLEEKTAGDLERFGVLVPSYSVTLRPEFYVPGSPAIGDTVPLVVRSGRLDVAGTVRVLGVTYAIGDDGSEDVSLEVGRPALTLTSLFREVTRDVAALARR